jgi:hypothetical protein
MKAGTTSLYHYLDQHPQIVMSRDKEPDFFTEEVNWSKGWRWYERQFSHAGPAILAVGEASTTYTKYPVHRGVAARIAEYLPDVRLIYVIRHPIDRIRSQYLHRVTIRVENRPFEVAVLEEPMYVHYSKYAMQLSQYLEHFSRSQILILTSEELRENRRNTVSRAYDFIGVDSDWVAPNLDKAYFAGEQRRSYPKWVQKIRHKTEVNRFSHLIPEGLKSRVGRPVQQRALPAVGDVPQDVMERLADLLRNDVHQLRAYMGPEFQGWGLV